MDQWSLYANSLDVRARDRCERKLEYGDSAIALWCHQHARNVQSNIDEGIQITGHVHVRMLLFILLIVQTLIKVQLVWQNTYTILSAGQYNMLS